MSLTHCLDSSSPLSDLSFTDVLLLPGPQHLPLLLFFLSHFPHIFVCAAHHHTPRSRYTAVVMNSCISTASAHCISGAFQERQSAPRRRRYALGLFFSDHALKQIHPVGQGVRCQWFQTHSTLQRSVWELWVTVLCLLLITCLYLSMHFHFYP